MMELSLLFLFSVDYTFMEQFHLCLSSSTNLKVESVFKCRKRVFNFKIGTHLSINLLVNAKMDDKSAFCVQVSGMRVM